MKQLFSFRAGTFQHIPHLVLCCFYSLQSTHLYNPTSPQGHQRHRCFPFLKTPFRMLGSLQKAFVVLSESDSHFPECVGGMGMVLGGSPHFEEYLKTYAQFVPDFERGFQGALSFMVMNMARNTWAWPNGRSSK